MPAVTGRAREREILAFATQGSGSRDEDRLRVLLDGTGARFFPFAREAKRASAAKLVSAGLRRPPALIVMEGTGLAGGLALLLLRALRGVPYVVSSGDAVGPFMGTRAAWLGLLGGVYERLLCRYSAGFIGWTPYLVGRALTFGTPRAMTAPGWAPHEAASASREEIRRRHGIPESAVVWGIVGSLEWSRRRGYCYGLELVEALRRTDGADVYVLVVGDGDGRARLEERAGPVSDRAVFTGRVPREEVPACLAAMDVASLPQSTDGVGSFRYTTKISEYAASGLPIVTGQLPLAYDLGEDWMWRLPGDAPWDPLYIDAVARLMATAGPPEIAERRSKVPRDLDLFDADRQREAVGDFIRDVVGRASGV
jgi:glycosyltransferase involved in cell wall biosynthesis